jgi:TRAP-type uncharacterized transport system substrate-binding protein
VTDPTSRSTDDPGDRHDGQSARDDVDGPGALAWIQRQVRRTRPEMFRVWLPWIGAACVVALLAWAFVKPAPPKRVVIAAGPEDGAYYAFAKQYADTFTGNKVTLDVRTTAGTLENYRLLASGEASLAIVQGGVRPDGLDGKVESIASIYLEPVWMFVREAQTPELFKFAGKTVAAGPEGSGTREITKHLMAANGALPVITLSTLGGRAAYDALRGGKIDVAILVISPGAPLLREMLADTSIRVLNWDCADAYSRHFRYLSKVTLPRGAVDLARDLPRQDVQLVAPAANLVCRADLHPAIIPLAARAAELAHERGDLLSEPKRFPSTAQVEWPLDPAAREYFKSGPPFLQRYLPFWVAAMVDRLKYLLLPLLTLVLPLMRIAPPLYVWRTRSRIYRWYKVVQAIDRHHSEDQPRPKAEVERDLEVLRVLERELSERKVPLSYMQEFYNLRVHVDLLRRRLERLAGGQGGEAKGVGRGVESLQNP